MKLYLLIAAFLLQLGITPISGQMRLSYMDLGSTDSIQKSPLRYFYPGNGGRNRVWDFSKKLSSRESFQVMFMKDSTGVVSVREPGKINYYRTTPDTLILIGSESPLEERKYVSQKVLRKFPLEFNDSVNKPFRCEGMYCGVHPFREVGTTLVNVDAEGALVLAKNDTVRNVKRVHTVDTYSVCMDNDVAALDTARLTQVIDERYEWYLPDSEYPVIEICTSTTYNNMDAVGTTSHAFCNLPNDKAAYYITEDNGEETDGQDDSYNEGTTESDVIHYKIGSNGGIINISYGLDADAEISIIISDYMGMTYRHKKWTQNAGQGYTTQINCSGLRPGIYILYINVNGKVYSEKVTL